MSKTWSFQKHAGTVTSAEKYTFRNWLYKKLFSHLQLVNEDIFLPIIFYTFVARQLT